MTIEKTATRSAKDVFSAVVSAVSVTHMSRSPFATGWPSSVFAARASSFVSVPSAVR